MSKRFVVATNGSSVENRDKITKFFDAKTWGYWHWFNELWVLVGVPDTYSAKSMWEELSNATGLNTELLIVFDIPPGQINWWGWAAKEGWEWMGTKLNS